MFLPSLTIFLVCQLLGEFVTRAAALPIPGPVLGMALLFTVLVIRGRIPDTMQSTAAGMLQTLGLLFVPAGVGVITHLHLLATEWRPIAAAVLGSTVLSIVVTGLIVHALDRHPTETD